MSAGISNYLANKLLDHAFRAVTWTPPTDIYARAHTGDPGANGTANASAQTTRYKATWAAATGGQAAASNAPEIVLNATETISFISYWDAPTAGNFLFSAAAAQAKGGVAGDIIRIATAPIFLNPIAAT